MHFIKLFKKKRKSSTKLILLYSSSNITLNLATIISGVLVAKFLLPEVLGAFTGYTIMVSYILLAQIGVPSGLGRQLPYYYGKGDAKNAHRIASSAQSWQLSLGAFVFSIIGVVALVLLLRGKYEAAAGVGVIGVQSLHAFYVTKYLKILYRTNNDFDKLARINFILSMISMLSVYFVIKFGFFGLCLRALIFAFFDSIFTWIWRPIKVGPKWHKTEFKELVRIGLPMFLVANVIGIWPVIQKTLILSLGGAKALGLFAVAVIVDSGMKSYSASVGNVIYPQLANSWGKEGSIVSLFDIIWKPFFESVIIILLLVPIGWVLLPYFINNFLPEYHEGLNAARWMLVVGFLQVFLVYTYIYSVINNQRDRLLSYLSGILVWAIMVFLLYLIYGFDLALFPKSMVAGLMVIIVVMWRHMVKYKRQQNYLKT